MLEERQDRERLAMVGSATAAIAHEIQNPLATKIDATGTNLEHSTLVGGDGDEDCGTSMMLDGFASVSLTGSTTSTDFPTTPDAFDASLGGSFDALLCRLSHDGAQLLYGTYLGGSDAERGYDIAGVASGDVVVVGRTQSESDFPTTPGAYDTTHEGGSCGLSGTCNDAFVVRLQLMLYGDGFETGDVSSWSNAVK